MVKEEDEAVTRRTRKKNIDTNEKSIVEKQILFTTIMLKVQS